jgi:YbgC/YbaW family acyl-CoA thioester hydrolase
MKTTTTMEIRFTDVDSQNHVNHTAIIEWIAHARVKMIDAKLKQYEDFIWTDKSKNDGPELDHVLVNMNVNFFKEVFYPGEIEVQGKILSVGNKSVTTKFFVYNSHERGNNDGPVAEAECVNVFFRTSTKESINMSDKFKEILMKKNDHSVVI